MFYDYVYWPVSIFWSLKSSFQNKSKMTFLFNSHSLVTFLGFVSILNLTGISISFIMSQHNWEFYELFNRLYRTMYGKYKAWRARQKPCIRNETEFSFSSINASELGVTEIHKFINVQNTKEMSDIPGQLSRSFECQLILF